ncbi:peptidyl-prolyl cis-trans isomerase [Spirochaetia bacterium]|nr:peptidyl-prolyl cis-trans isomerase [Spirochaetia bacterium]
MLKPAIRAVYPEILFYWNIFMKRTLFFILVVLVLIGCKGSGKADSIDTAADADAFVLDKDTSYALGMQFGADVGSMGIKFDNISFIQGTKDALGGKKTKMTVEEAATKVQTAYTAFMDKQSEPLRQAEAEFLAENARKSGVQVTASGLQYEVISEGTGPKPQASDTVMVIYEGTFLSGEPFDGSGGEPVGMSLDRVIPGWTEGIPLMSVGSNYRFYIPSNLGYGEQGYGQVIPPFSTLIFDVELIAIQ